MILCANLHRLKDSDSQIVSSQIPILDVRKNLLAGTQLFLEQLIRLKLRSFQKIKIKGCYFIGNIKRISGMQ